MKLIKGEFFMDMRDGGYKPIQVFLTTNEHKQLKILCVNKEISISEFIRKLIKKETN